MTNESRAAIDGINRSLADIVAPQITQLELVQRDPGMHLGQALEHFRRDGLPPNLRSIANDIDYDDVITFVEAEGIPFVSRTASVNGQAAPRGA